MKTIELISLLAIVACSFIDPTIGDCCHKEVEYQFLHYVTYDHCEGKDSGNYTLINQITRDAQCSPMSQKITPYDLLLSCSLNSKQTNVNQLKIVAQHSIPNGALSILEILFLVIGGPLEGKYIYERSVQQELQYLKICSSALGYSYVSSKSNTLLISDKLDLNILISPTGAFELFKKGCTTICQGNEISVGPTNIISKH